VAGVMKKKNKKGNGSIAELRRLIDKLDEQILNLLNKRAKIVMQIGRLKKVNFNFARGGKAMENYCG